MARRTLLIVIASLVLVILAVCAGVYLIRSTTQDTCSDGTSCQRLQDCIDVYDGTNPLVGVVMTSCGERTDLVCCLHPQASQMSRENTVGLLPINGCGSDVGNRISNGDDAVLGQFPWMALLAFRPTRSKGPPEFRCGGTLINDRYVLTAAHCVELGLPVFVRLGEYDLSRDDDSEDDYPVDPHVDSPVEKVIRHKQFNTTTLKDDIALIRLNTKVNITKYISPVCLPLSVNITDDDENLMYTIAGWGRMEHGNVNLSKILQFALVRNIPVTECSEVHERRVRPINDQQLCAGGEGSRGENVCKGDSGGPLLQQAEDNNGTYKMFQVGITSFGHVICGGDKPGVFARTSAYINWILFNLEP